MNDIKMESAIEQERRVESERNDRDYQFGFRLSSDNSFRSYEQFEADSWKGEDQS